MSETTASESFPSMVRRVLGDRLKPETETFPDMFAVDGVLEYPFAPPGLGTPISGRDAIVANFEKLRQHLRIDRVTDVFEIETTDPEVVVLEFNGYGVGIITQEPYHQRYISVIRLREGKISRYKDYWNPIALVRVVKG